MKKIFFFIFIFLLASVAKHSFAQTNACVPIKFVDAGTDTNNCSGPVKLTATVFNFPSTSTYSVSTIPYNPYPFNVGSIVLANIDDTWSQAINIPFCFKFFGNIYYDISIGSNEIVTFNITQAGGFCPWALTSSSGIPDVNLPLNSIMAPYQDIDPTNMGAIYWNTFGTAPNRAFVISFDSIPYYGDSNSVNNSICPPPKFATSQIVLYEATNTIDIFIHNKQTCSAWNGGLAIEGIQDATGTNAVAATGRNNTVWTATNDGICFSPAGTPANYSIAWYNVATGLQIGNTDSITVNPNSTTSYAAVVTYTLTCDTFQVSDTVIVQQCTAVPNIISQSSFSISPNPTNGIFNLKMNKFENSQLKIYNLLGECIEQKNITMENSQVDISKQPDGIYFLQLKTSEGFIAKKIIVEK